MDKHVHIVALEVPWPADYGGVIDLFYKLKVLHQLGVKIHLHCFTKNRLQQTELLKYCVTVNYYKRKSSLKSFSLSLPLIVSSRKNETLLKNLKKDNYPILLEGIHCTYYLHTADLSNRKIIVRLHNTEFEYYKHLAQHEKNIFKKMYYLHESILLKKYEKNIAKKYTALAVSKHDEEIYNNVLHAIDTAFMPVFIPYTLANGKTGKGSFCLYHGNLSINENEVAAIWLLQNVFNNLQIPFVIAGKNPSKKLIDLSHQNKHTCLVENPSEHEMQDLIAKAQINILPSFNNTGVKLKLINAVFNGRHVVVNIEGVKGSNLEPACAIATDATSFKEKIAQLYEQPFTNDDIELRQGLLLRNYNNTLSVKKITDIFWKGENFLNINRSII